MKERERDPIKGRKTHKESEAKSCKITNALKRGHENRKKISQPDTLHELILCFKKTNQH